MNNHPKYPVDTVIKASALIDALGDSEQEMSISALREVVGLSASTVHRLLDTLVSIGYVHRNPETRRYKLGIGLIQIGSRAIKQYGIYPDTRLYLEELAARTGETAKLGIRYFDRIVYIGLVESTNALRFTGSIGSSAPLHCTAMGKIILSSLPFEEQSLIICKLLPLEQFTPKTIVNPKKLKEEMIKVKQQGYALDLEEYFVGSCGIAFPVYNELNKLVASVCISGPIARMTQEKINQYLPELETTAKKLSNTNLPYWQF